MDWKIIISLVSMALAIVGAIATGAWILSAWKHKLDDLEPLRKNASGLLDMMENVKEIYRAIINQYGHPLAETKSPVSLTDYGREIANQINSQQLVDKYADKLYEDVKEMNAYQIQEYCFNFSKKKLLKKLEEEDKDRFDAINAIAYEKGIDIKRLMETAVGIPLRDKILSKTGKSHEEVDKHSLITQETNLCK